LSAIVVSSTNPHFSTGDSGVVRMSTATNSRESPANRNHRSITPSSTPPSGIAERPGRGAVQTVASVTTFSPSPGGHDQKGQKLPQQLHRHPPKVWRDPASINPILPEPDYISTCLRQFI
jgi:hypothetical protein